MITDIQTALPKTVGVGYKPQHYADILRHPPSLGWLEVHAENYLGSGGRPITQLRVLRKHMRFLCMGLACPLGRNRSLILFIYLGLNSYVIDQTLHSFLNTSPVPRMMWGF